MLLWPILIGVIGGFIRSIPAVKNSGYRLSIVFLTGVVAFFTVPEEKILIGTVSFVLAFLITVITGMIIFRKK